MPCHTDPPTASELKAWAEKASKESVAKYGIDMTDPDLPTRVACEVTSLLEKAGLLHLASPETQKWKVAHEQIDQEHIKQELANKQQQNERVLRESLKKQVENMSTADLDKLKNHLTTTP